VTGRPTSGLIFDFDGTVLDTETSVYDAWAAAYVMAGMQPIPRATWLRHIGKADDGTGLDVRGDLCAHLGVADVPAEIEAHRKAVRDEHLFDQQIRSGIVEWIQAATAVGLPLGVASSSPSEWVRPHLERLGLDGYFPVVSCADPPVPGKPDPTVYLTACAELDIDPTLAVAIEDSPNGVRAAIAAGMRCIATPGPMTTTLNFDHATLRADSLVDVAPGSWF